MQHLNELLCIPSMIREISFFLLLLIINQFNCQWHSLIQWTKLNNLHKRHYEKCLYQKIFEFVSYFKHMTYSSILVHQLHVNQITNKKILYHLYVNTFSSFYLNTCELILKGCPLSMLAYLKSYLWTQNVVNLFLSQNIKKALIIITGHIWAMQLLRVIPRSWLISGIPG